MIIDDLNIESIAVFETETQLPLIIDPDAPLPATIMLQGFQPVRGRLASAYPLFNPLNVPSRPHGVQG